MPKRDIGTGKGKSVGGSRRTSVLPCGHQVRGRRDQLKTAVRLHQKVCERCAPLNLSGVWLDKPLAENLTDLKSGGCGYNCPSARGGRDSIQMTNQVQTMVKKFDQPDSTPTIQTIESRGTDSITTILNQRREEIEQEPVELDISNLDGEEILEALQKLLEPEPKETKTQKKRRMKKNKAERTFNESIGLTAKTNAELNPFELDFAIKTKVEQEMERKYGK